MDINIYVNQKKINPLCSSAIAEYVKRLSPYCNMKIVCAPGHVKYTPGHNSAHYAVIQASQKVVSYGYGNWKSLIWPATAAKPWGNTSTPTISTW